MATTRFIHTLIALTAAAACSILAAPPSSAEPAAPAAEGKPVQLRTFMRKPVATSATRTVKKRNGEYAKVAVKRRPQAPPPATATATPAAPLSPAAAQAFAAYELARVRVVTAEDADSARFITDTPIEAMSVLAVDNVEVVSADEVNHIDRQADSSMAVSLDALSRDLAGSRSLASLYNVGPPGEPKAEADGWLQHLLVMLGSAFAGVTALVRILLG